MNFMIILTLQTLFQSFHYSVAFYMLHTIINDKLLHTASYHKQHHIANYYNCKLLLTVSNQKWQAIVSCKLSKTAHIAYYKIPKWKAIQIMRTARLQSIKTYCLPQDIKTRGRRSNNSLKQGHQADR